MRARERRAEERHGVTVGGAAGCSVTPWQIRRSRRSRELGVPGVRERTRVPKERGRVRIRIRVPRSHFSFLLPRASPALPARDSVSGQGSIEMNRSAHRESLVTCRLSSIERTDARLRNIRSAL